MRKEPTPAETDSEKAGGQLEALFEGRAADQERDERRRATFFGKGAGAMYVIGGIDLCAFLVGVMTLGRNYGLQAWFEVGAQLFIAVLSVNLIKFMDGSYRIGIGVRGFKTGLLALLPVAMIVAAWWHPIDRAVSLELPILAALSALTEAVWEESFFRGLGAFLLVKEDGKFGWLAAIATSLFYGLTRLMNLMLDPTAWKMVLTQCAFSVALGAFLMALYVYTKNLLVPMAVHFLLNLAQNELALYPGEVSLGWQGSWLMHGTAWIVMIVLAVWLFRRQEKRSVAAAPQTS